MLQPAPRRALLLALALDTLGEPPAWAHPVVWMGSYLNAARSRWTATTAAGQLVEGAGGWMLGVALSGAVGALASHRCWSMQGLLLKPLLARRALFVAVEDVHHALADGDLLEARRLLSWHLVSRDTATLDASGVTGAAIASLAENLSDSVVAPLIAARAGGLGLAAAYRFTNTADAMWGYRTPELEWPGKPAAHADDLLNLVPARLTALCAVLAAGGRGWRAWARDRRVTPSPNGGHPMAAFAGALDVRVEKRGVYVLNASGRPPVAADLPRALTLARRTLLLATACVLLPGTWRPL